MGSKNSILIRQIDVLKDDYTMKLHIIRLCKLSVFTNPSETFSIEMILMDEEGTKIQGNVLKRCVFRFEKLLKENSDFYVQSPQLGSNNSRYKYVDNPYKLTLNYDTKLRKCTDFNGPLYGFAFADYQPILERAILGDQIVDIIGHVVKCYELEMVP